MSDCGYAQHVLAMHYALPVRNAAVLVISTMPALEPPAAQAVAAAFPDAAVHAYAQLEPWMTSRQEERERSPRHLTTNCCDPIAAAEVSPGQVELLHIQMGVKSDEPAFRRLLQAWLPKLKGGGCVTVSEPAANSNLSAMVTQVLHEHGDPAQTCAACGGLIYWRKPSDATTEENRLDLYPQDRPLRIGAVIGTFAAVPYVHLQLEARRRLYPEVPLLIHDDASASDDQLRALASKYGADFVSTGRRLRHFTGDVSAFAHGLEWAERHGFDLLVKLSRRFLPLDHWPRDLCLLAKTSQYPTFSGWCGSVGFGFLTEALAMHVPSWHRHAFSALRAEVCRDSGELFVEGFVHNLAREVLSAVQCPRNVQYERAHPKAHDQHSYCYWNLLEGGRGGRNDRRLWHGCNSREEYYELSLRWGLPYALNDFQDPNQGQGDG